MRTKPWGAPALCLLALGTTAPGCGSSAPERSTPVATAGAAMPSNELPADPVRIAFGDCAGDTAAFVVGPRPEAFDREAVAEYIASLQPADEPEDVPEEEEVENAGILGVLEADDGAFSSLTGTGDITSGMDDADVYGGLLGDEVGEMQGGWGYGTAGVGPGGGGTGWGTIGSGRYGTIGHGSGTGSGYGTGSGRGGMKGRRSGTPEVRIGNASATGDLDKNIIRRYIRRKLPQIKYCYEKELLVKPGLRGTVVSEFVIDPDGKVSSSTASGINEKVSSCIAGVIKTINFPKPKGGGIVQVRYPFTFKAAADEDEKETKPETPAKVEEVEQEDVLEESSDPGPDPDEPYVAGQHNPLRTQADALEACLSTQAPGAAVVELSVGPDGVVIASKAFGIGDGDAAACVTRVASEVRWPEGAGTVHRCALSFGTREPGKARGLDLDADRLALDGETLMTVSELYSNPERTTRLVTATLEAEARRLESLPSEVVTEVGPLVLRPADLTPMELVNWITYELRISGMPWLLAAERDGGWQLLHDVTLPVVPVPLGTGDDSWFRRRSGYGWGGGGRAISIRVTADAVEIGVSQVDATVAVAHAGDRVDVTALAEALARLRAEHVPDRTRIDVAGLDVVPYGMVATAIEAARGAGFTDWILVAPGELAAASALP